MTRPPHRILIWFAVLLAGAVVAWNSRYSADMSFFLPSRPSVAQQVVIDQLQSGAVSRLLMLGIEGGDAVQRATVSRDLAARLARIKEFVSVENGAAGSLDVDRGFLFRHRYLLSPAVSPQRFTIEGLRSAIAGSIDLMASPAGILFKPYLTRDPTGELVQVLGGLNNVSQPRSREGVWASRDGARALLLVQTAALGSDTDGQARAIGLIEEQFAQAKQAAGVPQLRLALSGPGSFAVQTRALIRHEVMLLSLISMLGVAAVLYFVYRSARLVGLGLVPVFSGALLGVVAVSMAFGVVFGVTAGFGAALIGEAVDYSTYYFVQSGSEGTGNWCKRFWPTVRLGVLTSMAGCAPLLFSGFPGMAQLGLYAMVGVATAAVVTRYVLPDLAGSESHLAPMKSSSTRAAAAVFGTLRRFRWPTLALAGAAALYLGLQHERLWQPDLSLLSTVSESEVALDASLRADLAAPDSRYLVVVPAADRESALRAAERTASTLDRLVAEGVIAGYDSPTRFLPSQAVQSARRAALPKRDELERRLLAASVESPLAADKLGPFLDEVEQARQGPLLDRADLNGTHLALAVDALIMPRAGGWSVLLPLHFAPDRSNTPTASVREALAGSDAVFIDMKAEFDALYSGYLREAIRLSLAGLLAIVVLLAFALRSPRRLASVLLPLVLAVVFVLAGLHLLGVRLHLMHLIGLLLIVAIGSNYTLFFDSEGGALPNGTTLKSILIATVTTAIGFGTLSLSSVPVLHAMGVTVAPGAILALLLAAMFMFGRGER